MVEVPKEKVELMIDEIEVIRDVLINGENWELHQDLIHELLSSLTQSFKAILNINDTSMLLKS